MKIGQNRIAVIIGKNGETKRDLEDALGVQINLDSKTGDCEVRPLIEHPKYSPLNIFIAEKILNAINRGFNPTKAMKLLDETFDIEVFNLYNLLGKSEKKIKSGDAILPGDFFPILVSSPIIGDRNFIDP